MNTDIIWNTVDAMEFAEMTGSVSLPRMAVWSDIAIPHDAPEKTTGRLTLKNFFDISRSVFMKSESFSFSFLSKNAMYTTTMTNSTTRETSVAMAAPRIPIAGAPK